MKKLGLGRKAQQRGIFSLFVAMIIIQLFYSFAITTMAYVTPGDALNYVTSFSDLANDISLEDTSELIEQNLESQTNIPVIELGALVFYSGNIILDLMLNFAFAIPQMIGLLLNSISMILGIDGQLWAIGQLFFSVAFGAYYAISLMQLLLSLRSGNTGGLI